jgi:hypothetical protein
MTGLELELKKCNDILERARTSLLKAQKDLALLNARLPNLLPEDVMNFAANRRRLQDSVELLSRIVVERQEQADKLEEQIQQEKHWETKDVQEAHKKQVDDLLWRMAILPLSSPERKVLQKELDELERNNQ